MLATYRSNINSFIPGCHYLINTGRAYDGRLWRCAWNASRSREVPEMHSSHVNCNESRVRCNIPSFIAMEAMPARPSPSFLNSTPYTLASATAGKDATTWQTSFVDTFSPYRPRRGLRANDTFRNRDQKRYLPSIRVSGSIDEVKPTFFIVPTGSSGDFISTSIQAF